MRNDAQPFFRNQLPGLAADSVGFVFHADQRRFEVLDEFQLSLGESSRLLFGKRSGPLFEHLERRGRILDVVARRMGDRGPEQIVISLCLLQFFQYDLLELLEFFVRIPCFFYFRHGSNV